jgi:glycosyltransferase involved in cell wall biosynthesis
MYALIPARNEAPRVAQVVRGTLPHVDGVLVVANGCTDDTAEVARAAGAEVIESEPGYGRALLAGYRHLRGSSVVQLDADGQHPPEEIPLLVQHMSSVDLVIGSRFMGAPCYRVPLTRRVAILGLSSLTSALIRQHVRDVTSGFQALSPRAVAVFADHFPPDMPDANILVLARRMGLALREVPVEMRQRSGGHGIHDVRPSPRYVLRMAREVVREALMAPHPGTLSGE